MDEANKQEGFMHIIVAAVILSSASTLPAMTATVPADRYAASSVPSCVNDSTWIAPQQPVRIYGNTWHVGPQGLGVFLLTAPTGHVLIDGGVPGHEALIEANIRSLGIKLRDIKWILNSHAHCDHAGGLARLLRDTGAQLIAGAADSVLLARGGHDDPQYGDKLTFPPVRVMRTVADGERLQLGSLVLTAHATPGHTKGNTTWTWESCERERCLQLVDIGSLSAPGYTLVGNATYPDVAEDFARSFPMVAGLRCDIALASHPSRVEFWERVAKRHQGNADALIDSTRCQSVAQESKAGFEAALAQAGGHAAHDAAPAERVTLIERLGPYHRAIRTSSSGAQQFFDEGLTLLYGFNHAEAFASFARAAALDTLSPMPHWGMALSLGTNINDPAPADRLAKAYTHLAVAQRLAGHGSEVEQGLVASLRARYVADPVGDQVTREAAYAEAMGALAARFPDDADVGALHAESMMNLHPWRLHTADGAPEPWTPPITAELERVLAAHPEHPGANHYYIHAVEASRSPERAAAAAGRLETLVPGAGHLVHMPSHIYIRTGDYVRSAKTNAAAAAVDEAYFGPAGAETFYAMSYYSHNLQFESASAMFAGNLAEARASAVRTVRLTEPVADQMAMLEPFASQELFVLVRFGQWAAILANTTRAPKPTRTLQTGFVHWARGSALAGTGRVDAAAKELAALEAARRLVPQDAMVGPVNWGGDVLDVAIADLTGRLAEARRDYGAAVTAFTAAVAAEDKLGYNEPPDWLLPERERLGVVLLAAGNAAEAEQVFRAELVKHPGNPRALYGVWKSLAAQRRPTDEAERAFTAAWSVADMVLGSDLYPVR